MVTVPPRPSRTRLASNAFWRLLFFIGGSLGLAGAMVPLLAGPGILATDVMIAAVLGGEAVVLTVVAFCFLYGLRSTPFGLAPGFVQLPWTRSSPLRGGWWPVHELRLVTVVHGDEQGDAALQQLEAMLPPSGHRRRIARWMRFGRSSGGLLVVFPRRAMWYHSEPFNRGPPLPTFRRIESHWRAEVEAQYAGRPDPLG